MFGVEGPLAPQSAHWDARAEAGEQPSNSYDPDWRTEKRTVARPGAVLSKPLKVPELPLKESAASPVVDVAALDSLIVMLFAWPPQTALRSAAVSSENTIRVSGILLLPCLVLGCRRTALPLIAFRLARSQVLSRVFMDHPSSGCVTARLKSNLRRGEAPVAANGTHLTTNHVLLHRITYDSRRFPCCVASGGEL